jgi:hypothetical protein
MIDTISAVVVAEAAKRTVAFGVGTENSPLTEMASLKVVVALVRIERFVVEAEEVKTFSPILLKRRFPNALSLERFPERD